MNTYQMPEGVEHYPLKAVAVAATDVTTYQMPEGVEHREVGKVASGEWQA